MRRRAQVFHESLGIFEIRYIGCYIKHLYEQISNGSLIRVEFAEVQRKLQYY